MLFVQALITKIFGNRFSRWGLPVFTRGFFLRVEGWNEKTGHSGQTHIKFLLLVHLKNTIAAISDSWVLAFFVSLHPGGR
jgi:hypothetical protein